MAAVLALIMLPVIASIGFFVGTAYHGGSLATMFAMVAFVALAVGVLTGALRLVHSIEGPEH